MAKGYNIYKEKFIFLLYLDKYYLSYFPIFV